VNRQYWAAGIARSALCQCPLWVDFVEKVGSCAG